MVFNSGAYRGQLGVIKSKIRSQDGAVDVTLYEGRDTRDSSSSTSRRSGTFSIKAEDLSLAEPGKGCKIVVLSGPKMNKTGNVAVSAYFAY